MCSGRSQIGRALIIRGVDTLTVVDPGHFEPIAVRLLLPSGFSLNFLPVNQCPMRTPEGTNVLRAREVESPRPYIRSFPNR